MTKNEYSVCEDECGTYYASQAVNSVIWKIDDGIASNIIRDIHLDGNNTDVVTCEHSKPVLITGQVERASDRQVIVITKSDKLDVVYETKSGKRIALFAVEDAEGYEGRELMSGKTGGCEEI